MKTLEKIEQALEKADIRLNGDRPWDIQILNPKAIKQILLKGSLGAGESYVEGSWDAERLDETFTRLMRARLDSGFAALFPQMIWRLKKLFMNPQSKGRAFQVGEEHYDLDVDLFKNMLDKRMVYSCAYWKSAKNLDQAQEDKLELICQKLNLKPGMRVLDVGSGFGGFLIYAARKYGIKGLGITVSKSQLAEAEARAKGLDINFILMDWRDLKGSWDRIVSVGQFEHVGSKNYAAYMAKMKEILTPEGLFLLHTIGNDKTYAGADPWIEKYIFPNGEIPSLEQISKSLENNFILEDLHNIGADYDKTLMAWYDNFERSFPDKSTPFYRMWKYYLLTCAAAFRARRLELWQFVLSPEGILGGYERPSR